MPRLTRSSPNSSLSPPTSLNTSDTPISRTTRSATPRSSLPGKQASSTGLSTQKTPKDKGQDRIGYPSRHLKDKNGKEKDSNDGSQNIDTHRTPVSSRPLRSQSHSNIQGKGKHTWR